MSASQTDMFTKVGDPGTATTLSAPGHTIGGSSFKVVSTSNWPTGTGAIFAVDTVTLVSGQEVRDVGSYTEWEGVVTDSTTISSAVIRYGSDQNYPAGATTRVYIPVASSRENRLVDGLLVSHNQDGTLAASVGITTPKITTSINDVNGNEVIRTPATASATNDITVTNSPNGSAPKISASGSSDSNVNLNLQGKGTGSVQINGSDVYASFFDHVISGVQITPDSVGVNKNYSIAGGVVNIGGNPLIVVAVSAQTVGASKDRYIDLRDNGDGTAVFITNEVNNNAASQALVAGDMRIGIVVAGATTIATTASINQGQPSAALPIASSVAYSITDSLGNLICPRDPLRRTLGYKQIITSTSGNTSSSSTQITGLSCPIIPIPNRNIEILIGGGDATMNTTAGSIGVQIWRGVVGSGTQLQSTLLQIQSANQQNPLSVNSIDYLTSSTGITYNAGMSSDGTHVAQFIAGSTSPVYIWVRLA